MAFGNSITIGSKVFALLEPGNYINEASNADTPSLLQIQSTVKPGGESSYVARRRINKNNAITTLPDQQLQVYMVVRGNMQVFTQAEVEGAFQDLKDWLTPAVFTRLLRGEK